MKGWGVGGGKGGGGATPVEKTCGQNPGLGLLPLYHWEVPEGPAGMVPVALLFCAVREARAASGSVVAVAEPYRKL